MGFKRTSEGRVFFKGADNDDRPAPSDPNSTFPADPVVNIDQTQMQILMLLKSLNTKLKSTKDTQSGMKKQLLKYRETIKILEEKTEGHQKNYIDLEQKIAQKQNETIKKTTRVEEKIKETLGQLDQAKKLVLEVEKKSGAYDNSLEQIKSEIENRRKEEEKIARRQKEIEKAQKEQGEKMVDNVAVYVALTKRMSDSEARHEALDNKIEDATSEYLKLDRKIEKALEDRSRILRKIERIENAVMETRDALNAKAMVLLTQQGAVAGIDFPMLDDDALKADPVAINRRMQEEALMPWWRRPLRIQSTSLGMMLVIALLLGWIVSQATTSAPVQVSSSDMDAPKVALDLEENNSEQLKHASNASALPAADDVVIEDPTFESAEDVLKAADNNEGVVIEREQETPDATAHINLNNEKQVLEAFEKSPESVAQALNEIEPGTPPQEKAEKIAVREEKPAPAPKTETSATSSLRQRIKPDANLPDIAKKIEQQAFEGVPEAQHDMGAIYVAGHGQIKQDLPRAILWFEEAAKNGVANAKYNLGVLYHQGMGTAQNVDRAMQLYTEAATIGHPEAQYNLGIAYIEGIGVVYNPQKAAKYFEQAAGKGVTEAAYNLGLIYENGLLGETKPDEALMWYKAAADKGSPEAKSALEQLANSLGIALSDVNRVVENVKLAKQAKPGGWVAGSESPDTPEHQHLIAQIQQELIRRKLYPGPIDGTVGSGTENAIRKFQESSGMVVDGQPTQDLLTYLKEATPRSQYVPPEVNHMN